MSFLKIGTLAAILYLEALVHYFASFIYFFTDRVKFGTTDLNIMGFRTA